MRRGVQRPNLAALVAIGNEFESGLDFRQRTVMQRRARGGQGGAPLEGVMALHRICLLSGPVNPN